MEDRSLPNPCFNQRFHANIEFFVKPLCLRLGCLRVKLIDRDFSNDNITRKFKKKLRPLTQTHKTRDTNFTKIKRKKYIRVLLLLLINKNVC